ncbi:hypothetical protein FMEAI12_5270032 [Parafrankia sp. Ea1.12]|nr:hypothetical protein FMEAI12_5270032 [Parafrankia sp. Ea1.12]
MPFTLIEINHRESFCLHVIYQVDKRTTSL